MPAFELEYVRINQMIILYKTSYKILFGPGFKSRHLHRVKRGSTWELRLQGESRQTRPLITNFKVMETLDVSQDSHLPNYFVYVLFSLKDGGLYIGFSHNIKNRFIQHTNGVVYSTKNRRPLKMIYLETFINKSDAMAREEFLKSGFGREQLKKSLKNTLYFLKKQVGSPDRV